MKKIRVGFVTAQIDRKPNSGPNIYLRNLITQIHKNHSDEIELILFRSKQKTDQLDFGLEEYEISAELKKTYFKLPSVIKKSAIDILHMNLLPVYNIPFYSYKCKKAVTLHGDLAFTEPQLAKRRMKIRMGYGFKAISSLGLLDKIDLFFPVSNSVLTELSKRINIDIDKVRVVYNGIKQDIFIPEGSNDEKALNAHGVKPGYILHINNFSKKKNASTLLKSFAEYKQINSEASLVVIGRGWESEIAQQTIAESKLEAGVDFKLIPGLSNRELPPFYRGAKVFLNPTLHETFGITNLEAMACGTPVISTNRYSVPEVVENAGLLVDDPYDAKEFAAKIDQLMNDSTLYEKLRTEGVRRSSLFSWEKTASQTVEGYISLFH